jgi:hypothetical protein
MKKPPESVQAVISTEEPTAGSRPKRHRHRHDAAERDVAVEGVRDRPEQAAPDHAVQQRDAELLREQLPPVAVLDLAERHGAHDHGDGLVARVAADAGDDRHQRGKRDEVHDRVLEHADHARGDERGDEIDGEPRPAVLERVEHRREDVLLLLQARSGELRFGALLPDVVDDCVDREAADQPAARIDHRRRDEVVALEGARRLARGILGLESQAVAHGDSHHVDLEVGDDEPRERQRALQRLVAVDDEELIGMARQLVEAPQVARHRFQRHVVAHRDVLEIHQRADRALGVGERLAQLLALLGGERAHHLLDHRRGQVAGDVGELVGLQRLGGGDELLRVHARDEGLAHRFRYLDEDLAVAVRLHEVPDREALLGRQGLQQVGDVGGVQRVERRAQAGALAGEQRLDLAQLLLQLLGFEAGARFARRHGICAPSFSMRVRIVAARPSMYGVVRPWA